MRFRSRKHKKNASQANAGSSERKVESFNKMKTRVFVQQWFTKVSSIILLILFILACCFLPSRNNYAISPLRRYLQKMGILITPPVMDPRVLIAEGCVGSHGVAFIIAEIMNQHNLNVDLDMFGGEIELSEPEKNPFRSSAEALLRKEERFVSVFGPRHDEIMAEAFVQMNEYASQQYRILFFKANTHHLDDTQRAVTRGLKSMNAKFASVVRENLLDRAICIIKDCLYTDVGYPVKDGVKTDLCFSRRENKNVIVKAYISDFPKFIQFLNKMYWDGVRNLKYVDEMIAPARTESFEDLFQFEYTDNEEVFQKSHSAWISLLLSMIENIDEGIVEKVLRQYQNSHKMPPPHSELIENFDEFVDALDTMKDFKEYIRW